MGINLGWAVGLELSCSLDSSLQLETLISQFTVIHAVRELALVLLNCGTGRI